MINLRNPIPEIIKDEKAMFSLFRALDIIPYYGREEYTSHSFLNIIHILCNLNPSFNSSISQMSSFAFPKKIKVIEQQNPNLEVENDTVIDKNNSELFLKELLNLGVKSSEFSTIASQLHRDLKESGNAYLHVKRIELNGIVKYFIKPLAYKNCAYLGSQGQNRVIINSNVWDLRYMKEFTPIILKASYSENWNFTETEKGTTETILHLFENRSQSDYYGSGIGEKYINQLYTDFLQNDLFVKVAGTETVAKTILAFEKPDPTLFDMSVDVPDPNDFTKTVKLDYFENAVKTLRSLTTNEGDRNEAKSVGVMEYEHGTQPPTRVDLAINRDVNYAKFLKENTDTDITAALGWDRQLTGAAQTSGGIGGNIMIDLFIVKNAVTIEPMQQWGESVLNDLLNQILERDLPKMKHLGIKFSEPIRAVIERLNMKNNNQNAKNIN